MEIKNKTEESADLYFYGDIVSSEWGAWEQTDQYPDNIKNFLDEVKDKPNLNIYINSGGGSVFAGIAIYNMLKRHKAYKTVHVDGLAASIASVIAMAADKLIIPSNAFLMIHSPWVGAQGNAKDLRKMADDLDVMEEGILKIYQDNLKEGVDIETIKEMVHAETWMNGSVASEYFNVEVAEENKMAASASKYLDGYKNTPKNLMEKKVEEQKVETIPVIDNVENSIDEELELLALELDLL
ncbi:peptidase [Peribacillus butanolivorans]|uniref:head maturation protease, ClpP-related n=1 Tax=Peribacillus butanolivorans TaxID=421767 RepID=UPI0006A6A1B2|nr:peptidase [Peribacillus butanolivorans]